MNNKSKINWKVRFTNGVWLSGFISQTLLLLQALFLGLESLGAVQLDIDTIDAWVKWLLGMFNMLLAYLSYLGIVTDPTVDGMGDSQRSLQRAKPLKEIK